MINVDHNIAKVSRSAHRIHVRLEGDDNVFGSGGEWTVIPGHPAESADSVVIGHNLSGSVRLISRSRITHA